MARNNLPYQKKKKTFIHHLIQGKQKAMSLKTIMKQTRKRKEKFSARDQLACEANPECVQ